MMILKEKNRDKKKYGGIKEERSPSCASTTTFCQIYHFSLLLWDSFFYRTRPSSEFWIYLYAQRIGFLYRKVKGSDNVGSMKKDEHDYVGGGDTDNGGGDNEEVEV
jgi:hypothetical protein